jgi:uncharacterized protein (DUF2141 family)
MKTFTQKSAAMFDQFNKIKSSHKAVSILVTTLCFSSSIVAADIEVEIAGVNATASKIYVQLFNSEDNYVNGKALSATYIQAKLGANRVAFTNVPSGEYAVRFFQDENNNGTLDTNLFGMPSEGYGFSNKAKPNYGPVTYRDAVFTVTEDPSSQINHTEVIY